MKKYIQILCAAVAVTIMSNAMGQDQLYLIHEDDVLPSKIAEYNKASESFAAVLREANIPELASFGHSQEGDRYLWASPVENFAALDENSFGALQEKIGNEEFDALFDAYDGTFSAHRSFFVMYRDSLSYIPEGGDWNDEINYRRWDYSWVDPSMGEEAMAISKEWAKLHRSKAVPNGYRIFTGGIGTDVPLIIVCRWARGPVEMATQMANNQEVLGDAAAALWERTAKMLRKTETKTGWYMANISFVPEPPVE